MTFSLLPLYFCLGVAAYFLIGYLSRGKSNRLKPNDDSVESNKPVSNTGRLGISLRGASLSVLTRGRRRNLNRVRQLPISAKTVEVEHGSTASATLNLSLRQMVFLAGATTIVFVCVVYAIEWFTGASRQYIYAVPAFAIGAMAGTFFEPGAQGTGGPIKASFVAFSAILLALVALDHEYSLFHNLSKFNAGLLSLEFGQAGDRTENRSRSEGSVGGTPGGGDVSVPAFARTSGISYVTQQFDMLSSYIDDDDELAKKISATSQPDRQNDELKAYICKNFSNLAYQLKELQDKYNSEFPTLGGIANVSTNFRRFYEILQQLDVPDEPRAASDQKAVDPALLESIYKYDNPHGIVREQTKNYRKMLEEVDLNIQKFAQEVELESAVAAVPPPKAHKCKSSDYSPDSLHETLRRIVGFGSEVPDSSSLYGYFAILTAFAEYADGNRESAIRLLDNRIGRELKKLSTLAGRLDASANAGDRALDLYNVLRKQIMIVRLIRWETALIQLGSPSSDMDQVAFGRYVDGIEILTGNKYTKFSVIMQQEYQNMGKQLIAPSENGGLSSKCFSDFVSAPKEYRTLFWKFVYYNLFQFTNNVVSEAGTNRSIVLSLGKNRASSANMTRLFWGGQTEIIAQLDRWADDVVVFAHWVPCLEAEGFKPPAFAPSYFLESVGSYFEMKAYNFGVATARGSRGLENNERSISDESTRIVANCKAISMLRQAKDAFKEGSQEKSPELDEFLSNLKEFDYKQNLDDRIYRLKTWLTQNYDPPNIQKYCPDLG